MCIFCQIIKGEISSHKVYEDNDVLAFLDINPISPGHVLVIPKKHYQNLEKIPVQDLQNLIVIVKKIGYLLKTKLNVEGYNVEVNNDHISGQLVPHLHFHVIPRRTGDDPISWSRRKYAQGEAEEIVKKLKA
jgi:histidine triad (HIT) family protein